MCFFFVVRWELILGLVVYVAFALYFFQHRDFMEEAQRARRGGNVDWFKYKGYKEINKKIFDRK